MKIKNITYPTRLEEIPDTFNDNIDIFVKTTEGMHFTLTVCTPLFYFDYMDKENLNYVPVGTPDVIVKELTYDSIRKALETFCENDGYFMKIYFLSGDHDGAFSKQNLNKIIEKSNKCYSEYE